MIGRPILTAIVLSSAGFASDCPVTAPPNPPFVAPAPHQPIPDAPDFWYGTEDFFFYQGKRHERYFRGGRHPGDGSRDRHSDHRLLGDHEPLSRS